MSTAYFLLMLKEAARYRNMVRPYQTNFNRMSLDLFNEDDDLILHVRFSVNGEVTSGTITDKGVENGDVQEVFRRVKEYITERRP